MSGPWRVLVVLAGPPKNKEDDKRVVDKLLLSTAGTRVVCGGTTASIVARQLGHRVKVDLTTGSKDVPPTGEMAEVDMVTEGALTLAKTLEVIRSEAPLEQLRQQVDGASRLAVLLREADEIRMLVGTASNPAHQGLNLPNNLDTRRRLMEALSQELHRRGKEVHTDYF